VIGWDRKLLDLLPYVDLDRLNYVGWLASREHDRLVWLQARKY
jgi:hypothetical protein